MWVRRGRAGQLLNFKKIVCTGTVSFVGRGSSSIKQRNSHAHFLAELNINVEKQKLIKNKNMAKTAKNKVISKKRASTKPVVKSLGTLTIDSEAKLAEKLGSSFGEVKATGKRKKNKFVAISKDGRNRAYGESREHAMSNLLSGISNRPL